MQRQLVIKPLVDALFAYLKKMEPTVPTSGQLRKAYTYILNQEKYLRVFLEDGEVPIDNNASERAIRGFCIGKKNWQMIDTINGAHSSAIIYSIAETAKANNLKPYDCFVYLLEEIPKHMEQKDRTFLEVLLPWSKKLPEGIRKQQQPGPANYGGSQFFNVLAVERLPYVLSNGHIFPKMLIEIFLFHQFLIFCF